MIKLNEIYRTPQQVAEETLGPIDWVSDTKGFLTCPGAELHSTRNGRRDCAVWIEEDRPPTIHCLHDSCRDVIVRENFELRSNMGRAVLSTKPVDTTFMAHLQELRARRHQRGNALKIASEKSLPIIQAEYAWDLREMLGASPSPIPDEPSLHHQCYAGLFDDDAILWAGAVKDSGYFRHRFNFVRAKDLQAQRTPPPQFTCPTLFKPGSISRSQEQVVERVMLVVEADRIDPVVDAKLTRGEPLTAEDKLHNKLACGSIIRWLRDKVGLELRAVVDAANKSLHGHFDYPPPEVIAELKVILPALKCDPKLFGDTQPVRLPGAMRDGEFQRLLYLNLPKKEGAKC